MIDPAGGPYLFDTSAESWLARNDSAAPARWFREYLSIHRVHISAATVVERIRGYSLVWHRAQRHLRERIEESRIAYLQQLGVVLPIDGAIALVAGEIMAMLPEPPTPPRRGHRLAESRQERISRWRFDCIVGATGLVSRMMLIHNNAGDFESIRGAIEISPDRFPGLGPLELVRCTGLR